MQRWRFLIAKRLPVVGSALLVLSLFFGWGLAEAIDPARVGGVDAVPAQFQLGEELYLEKCATCHIGVPPAVFPTQTWIRLLQDASHYGTNIELPVDPKRLLIWNYIRFSSRPKLAEESTPYRFQQSRYFKALHPKVSLPERMGVGSCVSCHPGTGEYNFRTLAPEWEDAI